MDKTVSSTNSPWVDDVPALKPPGLHADIAVDVCVIGAGITGLTVAYMMAREGKSVIVLDDGPIGGGETQYTSAHLTSVLDLRYYQLERWHGEEGARLIAESHKTAIDFIHATFLRECIGCEFERVDGYLFAAPGQSLDELERELKAVQRAGMMAVSRMDRAPLSFFDTGPCLRFPDQAQFHPLKYLNGLVAAIQDYDGFVFGDTHVTKVEDGKRVHIETTTGIKITAGAAVVATHTPINDRLAIHTKQAAYQSYVITSRVPPALVPPGLYWDMADPYHYVRIQRGRDADLLIVGGEDHKTGQDDGPEVRWERLMAWTKERFPMVREVKHRWSGEIMESVDGLAFIGRNPGEKNVYISTGDSGNGITYGTIAGILIRDLITERPNEWAKLYDPSRVTLSAAKNFARETVNMAAQYGDWATPGDVSNAADISPDSGAVMRRGLKKVAVYRDAEGVFHECSAVCPHLGGIVTWNHAEKTWDCPCHGSRFDKFGKVFHGPANEDLKVTELKEESSPDIEPEPALPIRAENGVGKTF